MAHAQELVVDIYLKSKTIKLILTFKLCVQSVIRLMRGIKKIKFRSFVSQVSLVVACENGHISEFPWNEWVHKSLNPPAVENTFT